MVKFKKINNMTAAVIVRRNSKEEIPKKTRLLLETALLIGNTGDLVICNSNSVYTGANILENNPASKAVTDSPDNISHIENENGTNLAAAPNCPSNKAKNGSEPLAPENPPEYVFGSGSLPPTYWDQNIGSPPKYSVNYPNDPMKWLKSACEKFWAGNPRNRNPFLVDVYFHWSKYANKKLSKLHKKESEKYKNELHAWVKDSLTQLRNTPGLSQAISSKTKNLWKRLRRNPEVTNENYDDLIKATKKLPMVQKLMSSIDGWFARMPKNDDWLTLSDQQHRDQLRIIVEEEQGLDSYLWSKRVMLRLEKWWKLGFGFDPAILGLQDSKQRFKEFVALDCFANAVKLFGKRKPSNGVLIKKYDKWRDNELQCITMKYAMEEKTLSLPALPESLKKEYDDKLNILRNTSSPEVARAAQKFLTIIGWIEHQLKPFQQSQIINPTLCDLLPYDLKYQIAINLLNQTSKERLSRLPSTIANRILESYEKLNSRDNSGIRRWLEIKFSGFTRLSWVERLTCKGKWVRGIFKYFKCRGNDNPTILDVLCLKYADECKVFINKWLTQNTTAENNEDLSEHDSGDENGDSVSSSGSIDSAHNSDVVSTADSVYHTDCASSSESSVVHQPNKQ